jgi:hypothetical protein
MVECPPLTIGVVTFEAARTITGVPVAWTDGDRRIGSQRGIIWSRMNGTRVDANTVVDVFCGADWANPPYAASIGAVIRFKLAMSTCIMHVPDLSIKVGEVGEALKVATKASFETPNVGRVGFDLNTVDMDLYDRVSYKCSVLPNNMAIGTYVGDEAFRITSPMRLQLLLRP